jgi:hypothetical protein
MGDGNEMKSGGGRTGQVVVVAALLAFFLGMLVGWVLRSAAPGNSSSARNEGSSGAIPARGEGKVVPLVHHPASTIGSGMYERLGFVLPSVTPLAEDIPTLSLPKGVRESADLKITKLDYRREDRVAFDQRPLNLWVAGQNATVATVAGPEGGEMRSVRPARRLNDGVYCLHDGPLASARFSSVFIVRGYHKAAIANAEVIAEGGKGTLRVTVANDGDVPFEQGVVTVTLQRNEGVQKPVFSGRWQKNIPVVAGHGKVTVDIPVEARDQVKGEYYCFGWIGYPYAVNADLSLDTYQTKSFVLDGQ